MKMKLYFSSLTAEEKISLASTLDTSVPYLSQIANGHRLPSAKMSMRIEAETNKAVTKEDLRPDIYEPTQQKEAS